jgi:2-polyprenyl-6-methoxyphenol hydroxylase-like FAD-dependent oxidoreductase
MPVDFLIVGGGIGGAVLANLLGRHGKRVLVLERKRTPVGVPRPEILWPATVEVLRSLLPPALEERWLLPLRGGVVIYKGQELLHLDEKVFQEAGVQPCVTAHTRELLLEQAPCEVRRGMQVAGILREQGRVVGVRARDSLSGTAKEFRAAWTVGGDGAHSIIRRECGIGLRLKTFPVDLLTFAFDWPASLPGAMVRIWINEQRWRSGLPLLAALPLPGGRGAVLLPDRFGVFGHPARLREGLRGLAGQGPILAELLDGRSARGRLARIRIEWGLAARFGTEGAVLIGDAAHPVSPAGGQGANLAVADALALSDVAIHRPDRLLAEYERRRRPAARRSQLLTRMAGAVLSLPGPLLAVGGLFVPFVLRWINRWPIRFGRLLRFPATLFLERRPGGSF